MIDELIFRPCTAEDVDAAVPLIYSSGPAAFEYVFSHSYPQQALEFLAKAFVSKGSEFSYQQHTAAIADGRLVAVGALKNGSQNLQHMLAAAKCICRFYRLSCLGPIMRGLKVEQVICPPTKQLCLLYHLAVSEQYQGQGIGSLLLQHLLQLSNEQGFSHLGLDVADTNLNAKRLYQALGFVDDYHRDSQLHSRFGRVCGHTRMIKTS